MILGESYSADDDELPFEFSFRETPGKPLYAYYSGKCLMSKKLVETIQSAGVDNIQAFPATLTEQETGAVRDDYCVVNIIGLVASADLATSESIPLGGGQVFTSLSVDPDRAKGLLMFRLAESLIDVIVHEKVANAIEAGQFRGVLLSPVTSE
jgi:hypothetical protein